MYKIISFTNSKSASIETGTKYLIGLKLKSITYQMMIILS